MSLIGGLRYPSGIILDGAGNMLVSSAATADTTQVRRYATDGTSGSVLFYAGWNSGLGLAFDGVGHILYANNYGGAGGNKISQYTISGQLLKDLFITNLANPVS